MNAELETEWPELNKLLEEEKEELAHDYPYFKDIVKDLKKTTNLTAIRKNRRWLKNMFSKELKKAVGKLSESDRNKVEDVVFKVIDGIFDYIDPLTEIEEITLKFKDVKETDMLSVDNKKLQGFMDELDGVMQKLSDTDYFKTGLILEKTYYHEARSGPIVRMENQRQENMKKMLNLYNGFKKLVIARRKKSINKKEYKEEHKKLFLEYEKTIDMLFEDFEKGIKEKLPVGEFEKIKKHVGRFKKIFYMISRRATAKSVGCALISGVLGAIGYTIMAFLGVIVMATIICLIEGYAVVETLSGEVFPILLELGNIFIPLMMGLGFFLGFIEIGIGAQPVDEWLG